MSKKKTHDEYVAELAIKNPTVRVVEKYITARTKIMHHCLIHDIYWKTEPSNVLEGHGCCECKNERISASKYKSHEQYVEELSQKNPTIEVIDKYIDCYTPIKHRCLVDSYEWNIAPSNALSGKGCPQCVRKRVTEFNTKTHDEYVEELSKEKPHIDVIGRYINSHTKITHYCSIHDIYYDATPTNALHGCGCPQCISEVNHQKNLKTHEEYVSEMEIVNPLVQVIDTYINVNTPIMHRCIVHDFKWETTPASILQGSGCPICKSEKIRKAQSKTHEEYIKEVKNINPNIQVLGTYINARTPILHKCLIDNFEWNPMPYSISSGYGCPKCGIRKVADSLRKTNEEYIMQLEKCNRNIVAIEKYCGANIPISHKCLLDGCEWKAKPANILHGYGCPQCNESKGERRIRLWLDKNNIPYKVQKKFYNCSDIKPLPFDFYLPTLNIIIEYDGRQHFESIEFFGGQEYLEYVKMHDALKNEYCENNGIPLLRIPYYKFDNIEEELNNFLFI